MKFFHFTPTKNHFVILLLLISLPFIIAVSILQQTITQHAAGTQPQPLGQAGNWNLIFDDEFNGAAGSIPDPTKWQIMGGTSPPKWGVECFVNDRAHIYQDGLGNLVETATYNPNGVPCTNGSGPYESGGMTTGQPVNGLFSFKYGAVEARIKVPCQSGTGMWPAWWSDGPNWPTGGEIDYLEVMQGYNGTNAKQSLHGPSTTSTSWNIGNDNISPTQWCSQYHTYGMVWSPGIIQFTIDGKITSTNTPANMKTGWTWPFDNYNERLLLDLQVGSWGGQINNTTLPQSMLVDYVRVWQRCVTNCVNTPTPTVQAKLTITPQVTLTIKPQPTPTIIHQSPNISTNFSFTICPHGLGNCGDNANPSYVGNTSPMHPVRNVTLLFTNIANIQVATINGTVTYNQQSQNFQGKVNATNIPSGKYTVTVRMNGYLGAQIPGIITIVEGQINILPEIFLIAGDINNDNQLNIIDYETLLSCFGSKVSSSNCHAPITNQSTGADIDDDGVVSGSDYNLFIREISNIKGG